MHSDTHILNLGECDVGCHLKTLDNETGGENHPRDEFLAHPAAISRILIAVTALRIRQERRNEKGRFVAAFLKTGRGGEIIPGILPSTPAGPAFGRSNLFQTNLSTRFASSNLAG